LLLLQKLKKQKATEEEHKQAWIKNNWRAETSTMEVVLQMLVEQQAEQQEQRKMMMQMLMPSVQPSDADDTLSGSSDA
jgi:hypothetical protein